MKRAKALSLGVDTISCQLMEDAESRADAQAAKDPAADPSSLVGDVLDSAPTKSPGRALVRWRTLDGTLHERSLAVVKGLALEGETSCYCTGLATGRNGW